MNKFFTIFMTALLTCSGTLVYSQTGDAVVASEEEADSYSTIGIGIGAAAILATIVGLVVSSSTKSPKTSIPTAH